MAREQKHPEVFLALSPNGVAHALGISPRVVAAAILAGDLEVRQLGLARRIWVGDVEAWFKSKWLKKSRKPRSVPNA